jgi:undecaprenyl pyrophosphate phosphatase UppP
MSDTTQKGLSSTHAAVTAGSDLYFLLLVPLIVGNTKLQLKENINIAVLLVLATLGFVASLVRIRYIPIVLNHGLDFF